MTGEKTSRVVAAGMLAASFVPGGKIAGKLAGKFFRWARQTGSYTVHFKSGMRYHGKGSRLRSEISARLRSSKTDPHTATDWTPSPNTREAFKDEASRIRADGGIDNPNNYNKINSPGENYLMEDGVP